MISSKPLNILFPNFVLWCIILSRSIMQKDWFADFKGKITAQAHIIEIQQFRLYLLKCWSLCYYTWFYGTLSKARVFMEKLDHYVQGQGHSKNEKCQWMFCPGDIFYIAESFTTKLGMVMHHYEPDCHSKRLVCCL